MSPRRELPGAAADTVGGAVPGRGTVLAAVLRAPVVEGRAPTAQLSTRSVRRRELGVNWEAIGAIGEMVGAAGVIATLVYLAVQIRQNSLHLAESAKLAQAGAMEANANSANQFRELLITNPDLLDLFARGSESYLSLDPRERTKFSMLVRNLFNTTQIGHARYLMFRHDPDAYAGAERTIESLLRRKGIRECLEEAETDWRPEFRALVQSISQRIDRDGDA